MLITTLKRSSTLMSKTNMVNVLGEFENGFVLKFEIQRELKDFFKQKSFDFLLELDFKR